MKVYYRHGDDVKMCIFKKSDLKDIPKEDIYKLLYDSIKKIVGEEPSFVIQEEKERE